MNNSIDLTPAMTPEEIEADVVRPDPFPSEKRPFEASAKMLVEMNPGILSWTPSTMGKKGGSRTSPAKTRACSENGKKGGWPKGKPRGPRTAGGEAPGGSTFIDMKNYKSMIVVDGYGNITREFTKKDLPF